MPTVSMVVRKMLEEEPFIDDALEKGLINYTKLAHYLQERVEGEVGRKVEAPAILMALKRAGRSAREAGTANLDFSGCEIAVRGGVCEFNYRKTQGAIKAADSLFEVVDLAGGDILNVSYGNYEISVIVGEKLARQVGKKMEGEKLLSEAKKLSLLCVRFPKNIVGQVGFFSLITRALAWHGINIQETISTLTEFILVLNTKDAARAYDVLMELFSRKRSVGALE